MTSLELRIRRVSVAVMVILMACPAGTARAADPTDGRGTLWMEDNPAERRLALRVGPISSSVIGGEETVITLSASGRIVRSAIAHRIRVDLVDAGQRKLSGTAMWEAELFVGSAGHLAGSFGASLARLDRSRQSVDLPKPLGYRLEAGDSVIVVARIEGSSEGMDGDLYLMVTIEYEPLDGPVTRLAVVPVDLGRPDSLTADRDAGRSRSTWDWTPELDGRILALTGPAVGSARELVLQDAATGTVLWRTTNHQDAGAGFVRPSQCVRLGVVVEAGRGYRLTAVLPDSAAKGTSPEAGTVRALVLPVRAPSSASMEGK